MANGKKAFYLDEGERDIVFRCMTWCGSVTDTVKDSTGYDSYAKFSGRIAKATIARILPKFAPVEEPKP